MFDTSDTIVAIATPPGRGGIGVVRLSGGAAQEVARCVTTYGRRFAPRHATLTHARRPPRAPNGQEAIDEVVATFFPGPASYTGEDVVELSAHGSPVVLQAIVDAAMRAGARLAEPGEFTLRAFVNGRIDLAQAEAVRDLIEAVTPLQARAAFDQLQGTLTKRIAAFDATLFDLIARLEASVDFPDEGYHFLAPDTLAGDLHRLIATVEELIANGARGRLVREGLQVVIAGRPNVGKSSLFNALAGAERAIVTDVPGTTRDLITEVVDLEGLRVTLVDTAGLRSTTDRVEVEGVERSHRAQTVADLVLLVLDASVPVDGGDREMFEETADYKRLIVYNKADIADTHGEEPGLLVSAVTHQGLDTLRAAIIRALDIDVSRDCPAITNIRHIALMEDAKAALLRAQTSASGRGVSEEFVLADLQEARGCLEEIAGRRRSEDLLNHIFANFCIGK